MKKSEELKACREAFEIWITENDLRCPSIARSPVSDGYMLMQTQHAWGVWKACWQTRPPLEHIEGLTEAFAEINNVMANLRTHVEFDRASELMRAVQKISQAAKLYADNMEKDDV